VSNEVLELTEHVHEQLGQGGMGVVYKAEDLELRRTVALKFIRPGAKARDEAIARFKREAQAAAALNHPNIVTIYEFGEHEGQLYISMELVGGRSLAQLLRSGPLSWPQVVDIVSQVGDALSKAHERGIVHRDMKPENVVVDEDGRVKILDFGIAKPLSGSPALTGEPEQARGEPIDRRMDIWSLGVMLFEMVTGQLPYAGVFAKGVTIESVLSHPRPAGASRPRAGPGPGRAVPIGERPGRRPARASPSPARLGLDLFCAHARPAVAGGARACPNGDDVGRGGPVRAPPPTRRNNGSGGAEEQQERRALAERFGLTPTAVRVRAPVTAGLVPVTASCRSRRTLPCIRRS
jgi:serine/threonine-protein kinase